MRRRSASWLALLGGLAACALDFPDYDLAEEATSSAASTASSTSSTGTGGAPPLASDGEPCTDGSGCLSGHCLPSNTSDGLVCCAIDCPDEGASSCGLNGKCDASGADCAGYSAGEDCGDGAQLCQDGNIIKFECRGGACELSVPIPCEGGLLCEDGDSCKAACQTEDDCANPSGDPQGADCLVTECVSRPDGAACASDAECDSGACGANGRCCASPCPAGDSECGAVGCDSAGACVYPGSDVSCGASPSCDEGNLTGQVCDGAGSCGLVRARPCPGDLLCASGTSCFPSCGSNDATGDAFCPPGRWCDGSTCQLALWTSASLCSRDGQCRSQDCTPSGKCAAAKCDLDGDGVKRLDSECGGTDCDDGDARVYPEQPAFFATPRARGGYDFDCSGSVELQSEQTSCNPCTGEALLVPPGESGCGFTGPIRNCWWLLLACQALAPGTERTQLCH